MAQGADGGLRDVILVTRAQDGMDERLHPAVLRHQRLVLAVVACQVGQSARGTGEDVDIVHAQLVHQNLQHALQALLGLGKAVESEVDPQPQGLPKYAQWSKMA